MSNLNANFSFNETNEHEAAKILENILQIENKVQ